MTGDSGPLSELQAVDTPAACPYPLPSGIEPKAAQLEKPKRARLWAKYIRSLGPDPPRAPRIAHSEDQAVEVVPRAARASRAEKAPADVMKRLMGLQERSYYFEVWLNMDQSWAQVKAFETVY